MSAQAKIEFSAPWGLALKAMTGFFVALFFIVVGVLYSRIGPPLPWMRQLAVAIPLSVAAVSALFMVRGYFISGNVLGVRRLLWTTHFDLTRLETAHADPEALRSSIRVFGNGGLFSFTGFYRNKSLGVYRAFVTDAKRSVILRFTNKTIVVTPDDPAKFVAAIMAPASSS